MTVSDLLHGIRHWNDVEPIRGFLILGLPAQYRGQGRGSMEGVLEHDDISASGVTPGDLDGDLVGLAPGVEVQSGVEIGARSGY